MRILKNKRGEASFIELSVSLIVSVILGGLLVSAVIYIVNTSVAGGIRSQFKLEQDTVIQQDAEFNKEMPQE
jgi:hypothetical protein